MVLDEPVRVRLIFSTLKGLILEALDRIEKALKKLSWASL